jgi:hypothetical protein
MFAVEYAFSQVLVTPKKERPYASDIVFFFRPSNSRSMAERAKNKRPPPEIIPPISSRLLALGHPAFCLGQLLSRETTAMKHTPIATANGTACTSFEAPLKPLERPIEEWGG